MGNNYPKSVITNDGLMVYFKSEAQEIAAYNKEPGLFHNKPSCIKESIIPVKAVHELMADIVEDKPDIVEPSVPVQVELKRKPGRPAKARW